MQTSDIQGYGEQHMTKQAKLAALEGIARHERIRLNRFILRRVKDPAEAEDIAQQSFCEAVKCIDQYRSESSMRTWLYGIALNLANNHLRRSPSSRYRFESLDMVDEWVEGADSFEADSDRRDLLLRIKHHFDELPVAMQETLMLVVADDVTYEETAATLNVPVGTVRSRLSRARALLKAQMLAEGIEDCLS